MKRLTAASVLLLAGGVLVLVGLPLQWSTVAATDSGISISLRGVDYAGYDILTTVLIGVVLIAAAFAVAAGRRWGRRLGVIVALIACMWAALVVVAAANPSDNGNAITGVTVSVGLGAILVAVGAGLALIGSLTNFRGRDVAPAVTGAMSSV
jgi:hypothetical protein